MNMMLTKKIEAQLPKGGSNLASAKGTMSGWVTDEYRTIYYSALKKKRKNILKDATPGINLKDIILSEMSKSEKN